MADKPTFTDFPADIGFALDDLVRRAAHAIDPQAAFAEHGEASRATPSQCRADDLARLRATEALCADLSSTAHMLAYRLGGRPEAPVTYADLGEAVGISRQAATGRFPGAIPDAKPGRPRVRDPFPDLPLPDGVTVTGQVHRAFGRPYTDIGVPADLQTGDWVYIGEGSLGATPREVTGIENGGGGSWEIATADGDHTRVPAMKDTMVIRPSKTAP